MGEKYQSNIFCENYTKIKRQKRRYCTNSFLFVMCVKCKPNPHYRFSLCPQSLYMFSGSHSSSRTRLFFFLIQSDMNFLSPKRAHIRPHGDTHCFNTVLFYFFLPALVIRERHNKEAIGYSRPITTQYSCV